MVALSSRTQQIDYDFERKIDCPICQNSRRDCRRDKKNGWIYCRAESVTLPSDYEYRGDDKAGHGFYLYAPVNEQSEQSRELWQQRKLEQKKRKEQFQAAVMPVEKRDPLYQRLLSGLDEELDPTDKADLERRGVSLDQIRRWEIKSINQWQRLNGQYPKNLPGIGKNRKCLFNSYGGYIVPTRDPAGKISSLGQIWNRNFATDGDDPKYPWITGQSRKNKGGMPANLENGDLPLQVALPEKWNCDRAGQVALCEGTGIKPLIAADKLGIPVIGASSANFGNGETLKAYIEQISTLWADEAGAVDSAIVLMPDAAAVSNRNVMRAYQRLNALVSGGGWVLQVGWWNQLDKAAGDVDEMTDVDRIELIGWTEFMEIAVKNGGVDADELPAAPVETEPAEPAEDDEIVTGENDLGFLVDCETPEMVAYRELFTSGKDWCVINRSFYRWNEIYWQKLTDDQVRNLITHFLSKCYKFVKVGKQYKAAFAFATDSRKKSVFAYCKDLLNLQDPPANNHLITFLNKTLDVRTGQLYNHEKTDFITRYIAADYQPGMECPEIFLNFLENSYGSELIPVIRACISMYLDPTAPYGKFLYIQGASGSGKGVLLRTLIELIGEEFAMSMTDLSVFGAADKRHQFLSNTQLCVAPDVGGFASGLRAFYELVDNGKMGGRALHDSDGYLRCWNTRFALASVLPLQVENSGDGWDRRAIHIKTKAAAAKPDWQLEEKIREQKAAIISWAISMDRDERNAILMNPASVAPSIAENQTEQALIGDSIRAFIDKCLYPVDQGNDLNRISSAQLHSWYKAFCKQAGLHSKGLNQFVAHLRSVLPKHYVEKRRLRADESSQREMIGAGWINLADFPGLFVDINQAAAGDESNGFTGYVQTQPRNPVYECISDRLQDGQLKAFAEFNSQPQPAAAVVTEQPAPAVEPVAVEQPASPSTATDEPINQPQPQLAPDNTGAAAGDEVEPLAAEDVDSVVDAVLTAAKTGNADDFKFLTHLPKLHKGQIWAKIQDPDIRKSIRETINVATEV